MKKIIKLSESELIQIVKLIVKESEINEVDYTTKFNHSLIDVNGKKYNVNKGSTWKEKNINGEKFWINTQNKLYFNCQGKNNPKFEEEDLYRPTNISIMKGSQSLTSTMKKKLCQ